MRVGQIDPHHSGSFNVTSSPVAWGLNNPGPQLCGGAIQFNFATTQNKCKFRNIWRFLQPRSGAGVNDEHGT